MVNADGTAGGLTGADVAPLSCFICRKRKIKCSRHLPICSLCDRLKLPCEYPVKAQKPGPKKSTGPYASTTSSQKRRRESESAEEASHHRAKRGDTYTPPTDVDLSSLDDQDLDWFFQPSSAWIDFHSVDYASLAPALPSSADLPPIPLSDGLGLFDRLGTSLNLHPAECQSLLDLYFDNFMSFSLFHRPSFEQKLLEATDWDHVLALVSSMLAFSARFRLDAGAGYSYGGTQGQSFLTAPLASPDDYHILAAYYIDRSLQSTGSTVPPLILLQAMILRTFFGLIRGSLGEFATTSSDLVRMSRAMDLHRVDREPGFGLAHQGDGAHPSDWSAKEERRRAWWSVYELDLMCATSLRARPDTDGIEWETLLPVSDDFWFGNMPIASCFLDSDPMRRWKVLKDCRCRSPKAWYLASHSMLMSCTLLVESERGQEASPSYKVGRIQRGTETDASILGNSLQSFTLSLPHELKFRGQHLGFEDESLTNSPRVLDCSVYSIELMIQLTRLMLYHHEAVSASSDVKTKHVNTEAQALSKDLWGHYRSVTNCIVAVIRQSPPGHIRWVNPLISLVLWMAACVLQVYRATHSGFAEEEERLAQSKFDLLKACFQEYTEYWGFPSRLVDRLSLFDSNLARLRAPQENPLVVVDESGARSNPPESVEDAGAESDSALIQKLAELDVNSGGDSADGFIADMLTLPRFVAYWG